MSSLKKHGDYWRITFYNSKKTPKRKYLYYKSKELDPHKGYTASEIISHKKELELKYKNRTWSPWQPEEDSDGKAPSVTLKDGIQLFLKKEKHRLAKSTIEERTVMLSALLREYGNIDLTNLPDNYWEEYINSPDKYKTRETRKSIIYGLYKRLRKEGYTLPLNIEIIGKRQEKNLRKIVTSSQWLSVQEMEHLIESIPKFAEYNANEKDKRTKRKQHASPRPSYWLEDVIRLGFYTGLRKADLFAIRPSWIREDLKVVRIGGDYNAKSQLPEEVMPTLKEARPILKKLIDKTPDDNPLFYKVNADYASKRFKNLVRFALPHKANSIWFHCLRHSFVMYCMDTLKLRDRLIMQLTRHKDQRSLAKYKHHNIDSAIDELDSL